MPTNYDQIPEELCWTAQWCIAGIDEKGKYKVPCFLGNGTLYHADPTKPSQWSDFETAREFAEANPPHGLGFVLSAMDPYVCIDLDIKNEHNEPDPAKWTTPEALDRFNKIIMSFHSYTERSAGEQGYHIWLRGHLGKGVRRDGVEVYSQERFIVCTGDVVLNAPLAENQELLDQLVAEMRRGEAPILTLVDNEQVDSDEVLWERAMQAENGPKFVALCRGQWAEMGFPSQSEADSSLITMLAFYSVSNKQVMRMFRATELGKREKAVKNDYYLTTTLKKVRSIAAHEAESSIVGQNIAAALLHRLKTTPAAPPAAPQGSAPAWVAPIPAPSATAAPAAQRGTGNIASLGIPHYSEEQLKHDPNRFSASGPLTYPPGIVGELAHFIFQTSARPVKEVSVVAALGLIAGICGKAYGISKSGLNIYVILVGQSGIGKEALHTGVSEVIKIIASSVPSAPSFVNFTDFVSAPALTKAISEQNSFVNVCGEFGRKLKRMSNDHDGDSAIQQYRTALTNLYQKSGSTSIFGGLSYSDKDKNVASTNGVAYSMIGETTPGTLYDALTDTMMADGFLSRFTIVEYTGERPVLNENAEKYMPTHLQQSLSNTTTTALAIVKNSAALPIRVEQEDEAAEFLRKFNARCDAEINKTQDEGWRQMWNRAHLKVLRIAALLAAADNCQFPVIQIEHAMWAYDLIMRDIGIMSRRIEGGDVGISDATRENKILTLCKTYLTTALAPSYGIPDALHVAGIIPRKYLQLATQRTSSFSQHKLGQIAAMDLTIRSLVDGGYLVEVQKAEAIQKYSFHGKCYRILNLPLSKEEQKEIDKFRKTQAA